MSDETSGDAVRDERALFAPELLPGLVQGILLRRGAEGWSVRPDDFWCAVRPEGARKRTQGWKLHLSATPVSAALVLSVAAEILITERASFKFARSLEQVISLTEARAPRGGGGKFLTVYPEDDTQFLRLARQLHEATEGLGGPGILSDRRYRPDSLVHYRYGAFHGLPVLTNDGCMETMLVAPDGHPERDRREAWVTTPAWAQPVIPVPEADHPPASSAREAAAGGRNPVVLLNDRYVVRKAVRHAYKGGVYRATDERSGREVLIKEARPYVGGRLNGSDCRDDLRREAETLRMLEPLDLGPRALETFSQKGNLFLVQEYVPGTSLRKWVGDHPGRTLTDVVHLGLQVVDAVRKVHRHGHVMRDLNPNNLMVTPEDAVRVIDVETVAPQGVPVARMYTPGYAGPEVTTTRSRTTSPEPSADLYSLGAVLLHLATGADLLFMADSPDGAPPEDSRAARGRTHDERVAALTALAVADTPWSAPLLPLLRALTAADPAARWEIGRVREFLEGLRSRPSPAASVPAEAADDPLTGGRGLSAADRDRLLADGLRYLTETRGTGSDGHLWPLRNFAATNDPLNVQHGAAGVLGVLTRAAAAPGAVPELRRHVAGTAEWIHERLAGSLSPVPPDGPTLPGLYFGRSGTAWALLEAARLLADDTLTASAFALARAVPVDWPNRDICHGAAGAGMAQLRFWRESDDPSYRARAITCAEAILAAAEELPDGGVIWPIPVTFDSSLAGKRQYGFAHGIAGIGAFLLAAGEATGREDFLETARTAGDTLLRVARRENGGATWPGGERRSDGREPMLNWCNGSSGVGTFLIRLWRTTGSDRYRETAELAATAIRRSVARSSPAACHGLAGEADFLLDLAAALGDDRYRRWADELAAWIHARGVLRRGLLVLPDESMTAVCVSYGTGLSGTLATLLRLRDGGPRMWLPDSLAVPAAAGADAGRVTVEVA